MKHLPVLLLGCGGVGRQLLQHVINCRLHHRSMNVDLRVLGVCDSRSLVVADEFSLPAGFTDPLIMKICEAKASRNSLETLFNSGECEVFHGEEIEKRILTLTELFSKQSTGLVVVDCSASSGTVGTLQKALLFRGCAVLANKKPLTCHFEDYLNLTRDLRRIRYESTVGAGLPVIAAITRLLASGDSVHHVVGALSGTLSFVMSELEEGKLFSEVVKAAKDLGYTEPDPRDDLSGMDVARKALIIARLLGAKISMDDIKVDSLYPEKLGPNSLSTEDFIASGLSSLDGDIMERVRVASSRGKVLRYVCSIEEQGSRCQVGLHELPKDSPLGRLRGSDNVVEIYSRCYKNSPLVIQGAGAGNDTTACGVLADILDLVDLCALES